MRPPAVASRSIVPASAFVTTVVATPAAAVAVPRPAAVPAPPVLAKVTTVALSLVSVFPAASCRVAVSVLLAPEVLDPVATSWIRSAAPCVTV